MKHNLSPVVVNNIGTDLHERFDYNNNHWWIKLINKRLWITLWIIVIIVATVGIIFSISIFKLRFLTKPLAIVSMIFFVVAIILLTQSLVLRNKIYSNLTENLPFLQYYQLALADVNEQILLETITDSWTIEPQGNLPLEEKPLYYNYCENIMIGNINGQPFNYGSIINQKVVYDVGTSYNSMAQIVETEKTTCYYARFVYYTTIIKNTNFTMTLIPRNVFTKKFRRKNKVQLESLVFENLFEIKCDNQIKLRLILEPKIMDNLNKLVLSWQDSNFPIIHIENDQLTLSWKYDLGKNPYYDGKGKVMVVPTTNNYEKFTNNLLQMISKDITKLLQAMIWIENLSLLAI